MSSPAAEGGRGGQRSAKPRRIARIDPQRCIGCTKCIDACPYDAIIGAHRRMHTVIESLCIGCDLCVPPCPADCIEMSIAQPERPLARDEALAARARRDAREARLARGSTLRTPPGEDLKRRLVEAALRIARARNASTP